jgi:hypothetical protein
MGRWWARLTIPQRVLVAVLGGLVAVAVAGNAIGALVGGAPGGPASSSFSTGGDGLRAWSDLLERRGVDVVRRRDQPGAGDLRADDVVVLADPGEVGSALGRVLDDHLRAGGRLVVVGPSGADAAAALVGSPLDATSGLGPAVPWVPVPEVGGVGRLAATLGRVAPAGRWVGVAGDARGRAVVAVADRGRGRVVALADAALVDNQGLATADDAALALAVVGPSPHRVVFLESVHGFASEGLDALPASWRWAFGGLVVALVVGLWWAAPRFGPPEPARRELRPPRVDHVEALAADLGRVVVDDAEVVAPLVDALGERPGGVAGAADALAVGQRAAARQRARRGPPPVATVPTDRPLPGAQP